MPLHIQAGPDLDQSLVNVANALNDDYAGFSTDLGSHAVAYIYCHLDGNVLVLNSTDGGVGPVAIQFGTDPLTGLSSHINMPEPLLNDWRLALGLSFPLPGSPGSSQVYPIRLGNNLQTDYTITIQGGVTGASDNVYWLTATEGAAASSASTSDPYVQPLLE